MLGRWGSSHAEAALGGLVIFDGEAQRFLDAHHTCVMVTIRANGVPHVARVNCGLVDGKLWSLGAKDRLRNKHLLANPHAALCVLAPDRRWIGIEATVTIHDGPDVPEKALALQRAQGREPDDVTSYLAAVVSQARVMYEFEPQTIYGAFEPEAPDFIQRLRPTDS